GERRQATVRPGSSGWVCCLRPGRRSASGVSLYALPCWRRILAQDRSRPSGRAAVSSAPAPEIRWRVRRSEVCSAGQPVAAPDATRPGVHACKLLSTCTFPRVTAPAKNAGAAPRYGLPVAPVSHRPFGGPRTEVPPRVGAVFHSRALQRFHAEFTFPSVKCLGLRRRSGWFSSLTPTRSCGGRLPLDVQL